MSITVYYTVADGTILDQSMVPSATVRLLPVSQLLTVNH